jgi:tol-pal system protein YbgF
VARTCRAHEPMGAEGLTSSAFLQRAGLRVIVGAAILAFAGASSGRADEFLASPKAPSQRIAQASGLPPADVPGEPMDQGADPGALVVRIDRLENQLRAANGAIEELQNQQHRLEDQLKRFQEDVEFRLGGAHGATPPVAEAAPMAATPAPAPAKPVRRSDAFDPAADPNAPGAPRPIGTTPPSPPLTNPPAVASAPLELSRNNANPPALPAGRLDPSAQGPTVIAGIEGPPDDPREMFNAAMETFRVGQYEQAEQQLRAFLSHNANSRFAPDAIFYLGESFLQRSRPREAAEQYLKLSTDYSKSPRAPEGMLRLGQSLAALGNSDQACATFGEVGRRYPTSAVVVKKSVEREMQKDHC